MQLCAITQRWCYFACYVARMTKFFATWLIIIADRPLSGLHLTLLANLDTSSKIIYRISSYSFCGNYSFLNLEVVANSNSCRNISFFYLTNWIFATFWGRKLYKEIRYILTYLKDLSWCHHIGHSRICTVGLTKVRKIVVKIGHLAFHFFAAFLADIHKKN